MCLVVTLHKKWLNYFALIPDAASQIVEQNKFYETVLDIVLDTASFQVGGSIIPNEVPVTAGLVERLLDSNPIPFTKFILILYFKE